MPTIVSVAHTPVNLFNGSLGRYDLPGRGPVGAETGRYCSVHVPDVINEPEDVGGRVLTHQRDGRTVAKAFIETFAERGIFLAEGDLPSEKELEEAEAKYHDFLRKMYEQGLTQWERYHRPELVDNHAKIAAHVFRANAPWGVPARSAVTIECEGCGEQISPKLAWHAACGAIFDEERAIALGYTPAIQAKQARLSLQVVLAAPPAKEPAVAGKAR